MAIARRRDRLERFGNVRQREPTAGFIGTADLTKRPRLEDDSVVMHRSRTTLFGSFSSRPLDPALLRWACMLGSILALGCAGTVTGGSVTPSVPTESPTEVTPEVGRFEVITGVAAKQITGGYSFFCAILEDERVACWNAPSAPSRDDEPQPAVQVTVVQGIERAFRIAGGDNACAQLRNGQVRCWKEGRYRREDRVPVLVSAPPEWPRALTIGARYAAIVTADRGVAVWVPLIDVPVRLEAFGEAEAVVSGDEHVCALHANGRVSCVGEYDGDCPAYDDRVTGVLAPVELPTPLVLRHAWDDTDMVVVRAPEADPRSRLTGVVAMDAGTPTCAVLSSGRVACWGFYWMGSDHRRCGPFFVPGMTGARSVAVGAGFVCALVEGGRVSCWGSNESGQHGRPAEPEPRVVPEARIVPGLIGVHEIAASAEAVCARRGSEVVCWGGEEFATATPDVEPPGQLSD